MMTNGRLTSDGQTVEAIARRGDDDIAIAGTIDGCVKMTGNAGHAETTAQLGCTVRRRHP